MVNIFHLAKKHNVYVDQIAKRLSALINQKFRLSSCKIAGEQWTFYPDGHRTLCTKLDTHPVGRNLSPKDLLEKIPLRNRFCKDCIAIGICGGGCFWDGLTRFKSGVDERECYFNKIMFKNDDPKIMFKNAA